MMRSNKRGDLASEIVFFIPRLIFLTAVLFSVGILIKVFIITVIDIRQVESNVLIARLLYSRNGVSYFDKDIERVYPGIIDLQKFKELSMNNPNYQDETAISYGANNPIIAAKMILKQQGKEEITAYYNKDRYDKWEPRAVPGLKKGAGSVKLFEDKKYVLVMEDGKLSSGTLEFSIVI